jgi:putative transposase
MMAAREWYSAAELAALALPGLPATPRGVLKLVEREGWTAHARPRQGRGGGVEYPVSLLPEAARTRLMVHDRRPSGTARPDADEAWARFERAAPTARSEAERRLAMIAEIESLQRAGLGKARAVELAARAAGDAAVSCSTIYSWMARVEGVPASHRAAYLLPAHKGRALDGEACSADAWEHYKADYLRLARPPHAGCYRRLERAATANGWTIPSAKTLIRRIDAEIPQNVQVLFREGEKAFLHTFAHRTRDRASISAMQILNLDGHTWDVQVRWPNGTVSRPHALVVQDIRSGRILAIRHDLTLNHHLVRLALGDVFREHGLPDTIFMDNGRENAAAAISGGQHRLRWGKTPEEEPDGLLKLLGVKAIAVAPYWGQAKPIERAFRNFAHDLAKSPEFEGAYTGHNTVSKPENHGSRAIPLAEFEAIVRREIGFYNAQMGRRGLGMSGRSFDQVFAETLEARPRLTPAQLRLCLLASRPVSMAPHSNAVTVEGHTYWSPELAGLKRQRVIVRFDPEAMDQPAYVYSQDGRLLAEAPRVAAGSFDKASDGREHRRDLREYARGEKLKAKALKRLDARDVAARLAQAGAVPTPPTPDSTVVAVDFTAPRTPEALGVALATPPHPLRGSSPGGGARDPGHTDFDAKLRAAMGRLAGGG